MDMNSGYCGFSMSHGAADAYRDGERPLTKWTKKDIISGIYQMAEEEEIAISFTKEALQKLPLPLLRDIFLYNSSWHHTSSYCNVTDFFCLCDTEIGSQTDESLEEKFVHYKKQKEQEKIENAKMSEGENWECEFLEWSGTRNHPKAKKVQETGTIKGNWFFREDGSKKNIYANGFKKLRKV